MLNRIKNWKKNRITPKKNYVSIETLSKDISNLYEIIIELNKNVLKTHKDQAASADDILQLVHIIESHAHKTGIGPTTELDNKNFIIKLRDKLKEKI